MSTACLLLHGFGGTPFEVGYLADRMRESGLHVVTPTLPGHASSVEAFRKTFFKDWYGKVEAELEVLSASHQKVCVAGFSFGGALALLLACRHKVAGAAALSSPFFTYTQLACRQKSLLPLLAPVLQFIKPVIRQKTGSESSREIAPFKGYEGIMCVPQFVSLMSAVRLLRREIHHLTCPLLLMHDVNDRRVPASCSLEIAQASSAVSVEMIFTRMNEKITSHHMLPTHQETKELAAERLAGFALSL